VRSITIWIAMIVLLGLLIAKDLDQVSGRSRGISRKYDSAAISAKNRSTILSQEAEVGVKCKWKRGCALSAGTRDVDDAACKPRSPFRPACSELQPAAVSCAIERETEMSEAAGRRLDGLRGAPAVTHTSEARGPVPRARGAARRAANAACRGRSEGITQPSRSPLIPPFPSLAYKGRGEYRARRALPCPAFSA